MAMFASLRREERIGLGVAAALHALLVVAFVAQPDVRTDIEPAERMTVNLASEVGLEAAAPQPVAESRASIAPVIADEPAPAPQSTPQPRLERPVAASTPAPADTRQRRRPDRAVVQPKPAAKAGGGSRLGDNFLAGMGDSTRTSETRAPASAIGTSAKASLVQAISRELKPYWNPPRGADEDKLVTVLSFRLNPDGSLNGRPRILRQLGVNDANRSQAQRHGEQAIRAVQLAAPFELPDQYYDAWKLVSPFEFNWKLAQ